jgi:UDP-N-acetylglucosamine diphosphorylase/glucosamine-1-phosphate N-acetyltransferase
MMNIVLFDDPVIRMDLLPFTYTRPVAAIRVGILSVKEKWDKYFDHTSSWLTQDYLQEKFPLVTGDANLLINGAVCPDEILVKAVEDLKNGEALVQGQMVIAACMRDIRGFDLSKSHVKEYQGSLTVIDQVWKIFQNNGAQIRSDFKWLTSGRKSATLQDPHTRTYAQENIFLEEGAVIQAAVLNASTGPIYIGKNAQIQEGALIRGPFAMGEESIVAMGAKIRGDTSIGPHCKIGGEISNAVIFGYSNKAHDGFLGASVIGEWCNLGADSNTSNLKNNYENVKIWNYKNRTFKDTGLIFCGLMMGDHSKCGINMMFNTGTVVGISANIFGAGYPRNFIPSFAWGGSSGFSTYQLPKVFDTASKAMKRRRRELGESDQKILQHVFESTAAERVWEKKYEVR